jgi:hypothetical protein
MQNSASARKRNALGLTVFVLVASGFAKACKPAQKLFLELEIRCSIRLRYRAFCCDSLLFGGRRGLGVAAAVLCSPFSVRNILAEKLKTGC